jgi:hypothetical protein
LRSGVARRKVPASPTAAALRKLRASGWSIPALARAAEVSEATLWRALHSARARRGRVWSDIEARVIQLLGTPPPPRWAFSWDRCTACHSTERRHKARGLCTACYAAAHRPRRDGG